MSFRGGHHSRLIFGTRRSRSALLLAATLQALLQTPDSTARDRHSLDPETCAKLLKPSEIVQDYYSYELGYLDDGSGVETRLITSYEVKDSPVGQEEDSELFQVVRDSRTPEHIKTVEKYFRLLAEERNFTSERIRNFSQLEENIPLYRQSLYVLKNKTTGELIGMIRVVDGKRALMIGEHFDPLDEDLILHLKDFEDQNHWIPYERSLRSRGLTSTLIEELRDLDPNASIYELGRAHRKSDLAGEQAKALWELHSANESELTVAAHPGTRGYYVIHTDRAGAVLFGRSHSARIHEKVFPDKNGVLTLQRTDRVSKDDPPDTEYALLVDRVTYARKVAESFESNPLRKEMLRRSRRIREDVEELWKMIRKSQHLYEGPFNVTGPGVRIPVSSPPPAPAIVSPTAK